MKYQAICPPEWLSRSAVYQVNLRTFSKEGTIVALTKELPKLQELGFRVIYLCPIFEADDSEDINFWSKRQKQSNTNNPKNPYRMSNYFKIDSEYGTDGDLRELIETAHSLDMRVLLDAVYLHIGPNAPILKRHPEFAKQDKYGKTIYTGYNFPLLDYSSAGLREYLWCNMIYYIGEFDADGFRCDVGDGVPIDFWVEARRRMRAIKPDSVLINEGFKWDYLLAGFDSIYCVEWHEDLYSAFGGNMTALKLRECRERLESQFPAGAKTLSDIDNHDTVTDWPERTETIAGHKGMEQIEVINYLVDGIPMVYCGNELADTAKLSMFANRFHRGEFQATDRSIAKEDYSLRRQEVMKKLNKLKYESDVLCYGKTIWQNNSEPEKVFSFTRELTDKKVLFIGNISNTEVEVKLTDFSAEITNKLLESEEAVKLGGNGYIIPPYGYMVAEM